MTEIVSKQICFSPLSFSIGFGEFAHLMGALQERGAGVFDSVDTLMRTMTVEFLY